MIRRVALITLAGLLVVVGVWYMVFWRSETSHLKALKAQESQAAANVSQLQVQLDALKILQREVPVEKVDLSKLQQDVPEGPSLDQLVDTVNHAASAAGVTLTSIATPYPSGWGGGPSTTGPASGSGPPSMSLSISVNGNNSQLLRFITALDSEPRLYVVDNFTLDSSSEAASGITSLTVEAFYVSAAAADPASDFSLTELGLAPTKTVHIVIHPKPPAPVKAKATAHSHG